jgi:NAD(P)-dependent dehydrogenase (short-subunit alcohol dehydrogenase family)
MTTTALITGANKGIGRQTARQLAARGMTVLLGARDVARGSAAERELRAEGHPDARFVHLDVTDPKLIEAAAALVGEEYGQLDVLINNAGIAIWDDVPSRAVLDGIREAMEANVLGAIAVTNAMLPLLRRSPSPRVVNVSSGVGSLSRQSTPGSDVGPISGAYAPSKTFLNAITIQYVKELRQLGDERILVNAACPGHCDTDLNGHRGARSPQQGATVAIQLATLPADGPTGRFFNEDGELEW